MKRILAGLLVAGFGIMAQGQRIPAGTNVAVRFNRTISSSTARTGDRVDGTLAGPVVVNGRDIAEEGAPVVGEVTYAKRSGRFHNPGYLTVRLESIDIHGRRYKVDTSAIRDKGNGHTRSNVEKIGGGAGIGALIGGLAGGGKGALIGGLLGAGGGTAVAAATGRQKAEFPAEEVYQFELTRDAERGRRERR